MFFSNDQKRLKISPLARKIADEKGIDINKIQGSGDNGRIIKRDLEKLGPTDIFQNIKSTTNQSLSQMRKTIASRLSESKFTSPHFYLNIEVEMDNLIASRKLLNIKNKIKISFNDIIVKAVAMAIKKHPFINSSLSNNYITRNH